MQTAESSPLSVYPISQPLAYSYGHQERLAVQPEPATPSRPARSGRAQLSIGIIAGLLVGVGVAAGLALTGAWSGMSDAADATPITVPTGLTGLRLQDEPMIRATTIQLDRAANGGAAADVKVFLDSTGGRVIVHAIRARAAGVDLDLVGGDVQCQIYSAPVASNASPAGSSAAPSAFSASRCQRTDDSLTVQVFTQGVAVQDTVATTNETWAAVR